MNFGLVLGSLNIEELKNIETRQHNNIHKLIYSGHVRRGVVSVACLFSNFIKPVANSRGQKIKWN